MGKRIFFLILAVSVLACGSTTPRQLPPLYPTPTSNATQTPIVIQITNTPESSPTPELIYIVQTNTPISTTRCVSANVAVNLRPSPSDSNYPITPLINNSKVIDLGGRSGKWWFVQFGEFQGWVNSDYLGDCTNQ